MAFLMAKSFIAISLLHLLFASAQGKKASCWRYGHVCWGGHGKRSGNTQLMNNNENQGQTANNIYLNNIDSMANDYLWRLSSGEEEIANSKNIPDEALIKSNQKTFNGYNLGRLANALAKDEENDYIGDKIEPSKEENGQDQELQFSSSEQIPIMSSSPKSKINQGYIFKIIRPKKFT